jgi:glycerol-3-phosphate acyltransferase PlsY
MSLLNHLLETSSLLGTLSAFIPEFMRELHPGQRVTLLLPVAYMLGSVPFGQVIALMKGKDLMQHGSRNIGATNAGRVLGRKYFWIVFLLDMLKGLLPMLAAGVLMSDELENNGHLTLNQNVMWLAVGFACIIGHMFSAFLKFKGGKGVATSAGVILGLFPYFTLPGIGVLLVWLILFKATRYVSVASIAAAISFPIFYIAVGIWRHWPIQGEQLPLGIFAVVVATLLVYKHRSNIRRLREGKEPHYRPRSSREHHHHREAEAAG